MAALDRNYLLKISDSQELTKFLHVCVDGLINEKRASFENYNSDVEWTNEEFQKARDFIQTVYKANVIEDAEDVELKLHNLGENAERCIRNCYKIRKPEIVQYLMKRSVVRKGHLLVQNIDWKLKWVMGSSKLASISEPLLQVDLHCLHNEDDGRKTVNFEMNLEQVDKLISDLESVKGEFK